MPAAPGFIVAYRAGGQSGEIVEQVPKGESVQNWTRMITLQRFTAGASRMSAAQILDRMAAGLQASCPGGRISGRRQSGGLAQMRADCPNNPATGKPETFFAKALPGKSDMHMVQVAFRRVPTAADVRWAESYLAQVSLKP